MPLKKNKELKLFYSTQEVAEMLGLTESQLRYWEQEFPSINPKKAGRNIRQYTKEDIDAVKLVYHYVKECGMTISGAREVIKNHKPNSSIKTTNDVIKRLKDIKAELQAINNELNNLE